MFVGPVFNLFEYQRRLATTDLYFINPVEALGFDVRAIIPIGRHIYKAGSLVVISRYATYDELRALRNRRVGCIVYLADDDFLAGANDPTLPDSYRDRLNAFVSSTWPEIRSMADFVLVPSPALSEYYGAAARRVHPLWHVPPSTTDHFNGIAKLDLAYLGTRSHLEDFALIAPGLSILLRERADITLTTWLGDFMPAEFLINARVTAHQPMRWWRYKQEIVKRRFHLAFYPLRSTRFNAARSTNKLFEHSITGAATLTSPFEALNDMLTPAISSALVPGTQDAWRERIYAAVNSPEALKFHAEQLRVDILGRNLNNELLGFWDNLITDYLPRIRPPSA